MLKSVVDIGSNSVVLLISKWNEHEWTTVYEDYKITRLGYRVKSTGNIQEEQALLTLEALRAFREISKKQSVAQEFYLATKAVRMAENKDWFLGLALESGFQITVLSGEEEARYGFLSVSQDPLFSKYDVISMIDPGAQSTELVIARKNKDIDPLGRDILFQHSFNIGALGLLEIIQDKEVIDENLKLVLEKEIDTVLQKESFQSLKNTPIVLGSPGTDLCIIHQGLEKWDISKVHGQKISREILEKGIELFSSKTSLERQAIPYMPKGRGETIHLGSIIVERFLKYLNEDFFYVSGKGWRHAILSNY